MNHLLKNIGSRKKRTYIYTHQSDNICCIIISLLPVLVLNSDDITSITGNLKLFHSRKTLTLQTSITASRFQLHKST